MTGDRFTSGTDRCECDQVPAVEDCTHAVFEATDDDKIICEACRDDLIADGGEPPIPNEDPYENPDEWTFYCEDCEAELSVDDAREHRDRAHHMTEEYEP